MKIEDFRGKRVTVMGIGLHGGGVGVINFFYQAGAKVLATDLRSRRELRESLDALRNFNGIRYMLGQHREEDFKNTDLVIKNPDVPSDSKFLKIARDNGVPIETDIGIFFELCQATIIGVTGSRGKSTTAALIYQFLKPKHPDTVLAGNIRMSVLEKLAQIKKTTLVVLELSSWQLNGLNKHQKSPQVAVMTNIMPDHQNRYTSMDDYLEDKKVIYKFQNKGDFLVLNFDDETLNPLAGEAKSRTYYFSQNAQSMAELEKMPQTNQAVRIGAHLADKSMFFGASKEKIAEVSDIKLAGKHNLSNALAAVTVAKLFNVPSRTIKKVLQEFSGLQGRQELIKEINGVKYINDTTSTIPEATIAAINTLTDHLPANTRRLILIAGGADKNLDFTQLAEILPGRAKAVFLLDGTATPKLEDAIKKALLTAKPVLPPAKKGHAKTAMPKLTVKKFRNMPSAVHAAKRLAKAGDIVLLSPGCASFGLFRHEFERGEAFNDAANKL
ncbi:MAG: UDP-N-acetylmuramoyl-L-alanine--D-glutamate ligase [bacterium]